jgi:hypothetical protein
MDFVIDMNASGDVKASACLYPTGLDIPISRQDIVSLGLVCIASGLDTSRPQSNRESCCRMIVDNLSRHEQTINESVVESWLRVTWPRVKPIGFWLAVINTHSVDCVIYDHHELPFVLRRLSIEFDHRMKSSGSNRIQFMLPIGWCCCQSPTDCGLASVHGLTKIWKCGHTISIGVERFVREGWTSQLFNGLTKIFFTAWHA